MKYTKEKLEEAVKQSECWSDVARYFGKRANTGSVTHLVKQIKRFEINTSHFLSVGELSSRRNGSSKKRKPKESILVLRSKDYREDCRKLNRALLESDIEYKCSLCSIKDTWNNKSITLQIDHINGNCLDNRIENLRFLCPNCHSQTKTYCRRKNNGNVAESGYAEVLETSEHTKVRAGSTPVITTCIDCNKPKSRNSIRCKSCAVVLRHKNYSKRPSKEQLEQDLIQFDYNLCAIGRHYKVTDNAVRKWIKYYK